MAVISASTVKELREKTGAGMMDCKRALGETNADMEAAVDWLRKKGLSKAAKKAGRTAAEGLVGIALTDGVGVAVEVNAETDFVARNDEFKAFVKKAAELALGVDGDVEKLKAASFGAETVEQTLTNLIAKIGENMSLRRAAAIKVSPGVVAAYVHNAAGPNLGKIGILVALKSEGDKEKLAHLGKQLAMHVAAASPLAVTVDTLPADVVAHERSVQGEIVAQKSAGKPAAIVEKMLEGVMHKFYEENVLLSQIFVIDGKTKVDDVLKAAAKDVGAPVEVAGFVRFKVGEGIEKKAEDFQDEVSKLAGH
jgi:elongation factor Ts